MTRNMGALDRGLRLVIGVALLVATFALGSGVGGAAWVMAVGAAVMTLTALLGNCPAYTLVGIKTCKA